MHTFYIAVTCFPSVVLPPNLLNETRPFIEDIQHFKSIHLVEPMLIHLSVNIGIRLHSPISDPPTHRKESCLRFDLLAGSQSPILSWNSTKQDFNSFLPFAAVTLPDFVRVALVMAETKLWWYLLANRWNHICMKGVEGLRVCLFSKSPSSDNEMSQLVRNPECIVVLKIHTGRWEFKVSRHREGGNI